MSDPFSRAADGVRSAIAIIGCVVVVALVLFSFLTQRYCRGFCAGERTFLGQWIAAQGQLGQSIMATGELLLYGGVCLLIVIVFVGWLREVAP